MFFYRDILDRSKLLSIASSAQPDSDTKPKSENTINETIFHFIYPDSPIRDDRK